MVSKFSLLTHVIMLVLVMVLMLGVCDANSAGVGVPCIAVQGYGGKLGHPTRGDLQNYQNQIDAAGMQDVATIKENRKKHMEELEEDGYKMYWALPPAQNARYTVRAGDGLPGSDPSSYVPNEWMNIYVRTLDEGMQFTGLILYAVNEQGVTVGDWKVQEGTGFRYGEQSPGGPKCLTHSNAEFKHYLNVFKFKAPSAGTKTIEFLAMVKIGLAFPVLTGAFYYPNLENLKLTEATAKVPRWFQGIPGQSCDQVCASQGGGGVCDLNTLTTTGSDKAAFKAVADAFSPDCMGPIMAGCGATTPSVGTEGCFFHDAVCGDKPTVPPAVRVDPCEGLTEFTGQNGRFAAGACFKWAFERQNNGLGRDYNDLYYKDGQAKIMVKVCNTGNQEHEMKTQDAFGEGKMEVTAACAPPGGYTPAPTPVPPPAKQRAAISCGAQDTQAEDGGRICACSGGDPPTDNGNGGNSDPNNPGGTLAPGDDNNNNNGGGDVNFLDSGVGPLSSPSVAVVSIALLVSMSGSYAMVGSRMFGFLSVLSLGLSVDAHNWMSSPSRADNGFNAYQTAPCPPKGGRVHFQVAAGQKFAMEFATGHSTPARGGTYLTVLKAEDEAQMKKHTRALLDDYLASVPAGTAEYMAEHKSHHVGSTAGSTTGGDVSANFQQYVAGTKTAGNIRNFGPNWGNKPGRNSPIYAKTADATKDDLRVSYKSEKYPWIISCHKFKLHEDKSEEADMVLMEIPPGSATGQYIVQYSWNGYYDCTDVNVISAQSTDLFGTPATTVQYQKLDHCLWNPAYDGYEVTGDCVELPKGAGADDCFSRCTGDCYGVQVVPFALSPMLGKKGMFKQKTSTMPARCDNLNNVAADSNVCFPVKPGASVVGSTYFSSTDPYDSVFYGTCYVKGGAWNFDQAGPGAATVPDVDTFKFGQECIDCGMMRNNRQDGVVPFWEITFGECEHCDRSLG